jgi:outer membrane receptor protein involved in Fe transport
MKKTLLLTFLSFILFSYSYGQATIKGKVTDKKNGETLIGVTISLKSKPGVGVTTDLDGNFTLILPDATVQTLLISYISYETKEEIVHPVMGETIIKDFALQSVSQDLGTIEVGVKAKKSNQYYMENIKQKSSASIDFISSETMKKTGDVNVTAAVSRVSGVSMNNGFITVRGIGDRYVKTTINGSRIPTLDPFTNNIRLDLFPASLIDNVILTKTANPDLPGDWAGAYISLETKDYPDKLAINMETSVGYNKQTTFKDVASSERSSTDWLGFDNGFREFDHNSFVTNPRVSYSSFSGSQYQQMVGLGLENFYKSLGITSSTPWNPTYFNLGLVQLGLLDKELLNNSDAVNAATEKYKNGGYVGKAFDGYNASAVQSSQSIKNNWNTSIRKAPLNFSQSLSIGNQTKLFNRVLGVVAGFRYGSGIQYDPSSISQRASMSKDGIEINTLTPEVSKQTNTWSALFNLAYKLNINNSVSLLFMPNFTGANNVRNVVDDRDNTQSFLTKSQFYEQRKQLVYQYKSEHIIPGPNIKLNLNASYTNGKSSAPDFKNVSFIKNADGTYQIGGSIGDGIHRFYRYLTDNIFDSRIAAEIPLHETEELIRKLKFGAAYQFNNKKSDQYDYSVLSDLTDHPVILTSDDLKPYFNTDHFGIKNNPDTPGKKEIDMYYISTDDPANHTFGKSSITSAYGMLDYSIISSLRVSGGIRVEQANIYTDAVKYDQMHLKADDFRRQQEGKIINPGKLNKISYLPSATAIYKIRKDEKAPINLRASFSQTVARPSIRELSNVSMFDYEFRAPVVGNPDLKIAKIKNYDLRFESYFKSGDNASVSLFYKDFKDHIELVNYNVVTWENVDKAHVMGIELEAKKAIVKHLEFRTNVTFVRSRTTFVRKQEVGTNNFIPVDTVTRPMFGQAPYIINGMLTYTADSMGLTLTVSYNIQGPRLALSSILKDIPDVYELPRHLLDFKVSKKIGKHFSTSLTVRDILNAPIRRAYKFDNWDTNYDQYRYGTNFVLGVSYQF